MSEIKEKLKDIYDYLDDISDMVEQVKNVKFMNSKVPNPENLDDYYTEFFRCLHFRIHISQSQINELAEGELINPKE